MTVPSIVSAFSAIAALFPGGPVLKTRQIWVLLVALDDKH
ncbi:hypothetical protein A359_04870 [secondary endosymbiont of Ctenarytaina eucalypti]|uniref:Uncharacterized protein n=1 Tax=secondary endosymbiont of Ctenarytaina eucalypti TaxID=1199245 RepID=J3TXI2_9ENTR|nr:hypothetical protein A359_04870 [secondary endosymbiont of Ctenarytaina eucalypti]